MKKSYPFLVKKIKKKNPLIYIYMLVGERGDFLWKSDVKNGKKVVKSAHNKIAKIFLQEAHKSIDEMEKVW